MSTPAVQLRSRVASIGDAAVERARLSVVPRTKVRAPRIPFVTLVSLVLLGGVIGLLMFNTSMQQASFAASDLEERASTMAAREQTLRRELDALRSPQRIAEEAQRMGMVVPTAPAFLALDGTVVGTPTPATPADGLQLAPRPDAKPAHLDPPATVIEVPATTTPPPAAAQSETRRSGKRR
jgi:hypothetical protein